MRRKNGIPGKCFPYRPVIVVGMLLVFFAAIFSTGAALAQTDAAEKKACKALPGASYSAKVPEKPVHKAEEKTAQAPIIDPKADKILRSMAQYLQRSEQFTVKAEISFDDLLASGQKVQFAASENLAVRKPNGVSVEYSGD